ncbi:MAG: M14 family metallopeptidase [Planctomyces sp.]|nr:M14 family metallopeptidase [Planctomyces sp.]
MKSPIRPFLSHSFPSCLCIWLLTGHLFAQVSSDLCAQDTILIPNELLTVAEASNYEATCTSADVHRFLIECDGRADHVQHFEFGRTSLDQPMSAILCANPPVSDRPNDDRLTVLLLGNIHSGECDGKEALLMLARELTLTTDHPWLKELVVIIVPNYNADGNDQMSEDNRPGQIGPIRGMGRRETAQGFDLNRDFIKLESPESRALVSLINHWNPEVLIDCHTTNGSIHRYPLTYDIPHNPASPPELRDFLRQQMIPDVTSRMTTAGFDTFYYGNFSKDHKRWESYGFEPRYSTEYLGLRGRIGILAESYSYADYRTRVTVSKEFVRQCLESTIAHSGRIKELLMSIESRSMKSGETPSAQTLALNAVMRPFHHSVTVLGRAPDSEEPKDYEVEYWGDYQPTREVQLPFAYAIPNPSEQVVQNLKNHGLQLEVLNKPLRTEVSVRTIESLTQSPRPFQKHNLVKLETAETREIRELPANTIVVRTAQPLGRLAAWLLEPESSDGLVTWNFFDDRISNGSEFPVLNVVQPLPTQDGQVK